MTAHEFARKLLSGPDLPIFTPRVFEYSDSEEHGVVEPASATFKAIDPITERPMDAVMISYIEDDIDRDHREAVRALAVRSRPAERLRVL